MGNRLEAELGYAQPVGRRLMGTPHFGVGASEQGRDYRFTVTAGGECSRPSPMPTLVFLSQPRRPSPLLASFFEAFQNGSGKLVALPDRPHLPERVPAIDDQIVAGRVRGGVRSEEDHGPLIIGRDA